MIKNESVDIKAHHISFYYALLVLVILIWGITPVLAPYIYRYVSPTLYSLISSAVSVVSLIPIIGRNFSRIDKKLFMVAIPTGIFKSIAALLQRIGLVYTTPARSAFLDNLSCIVVPVLMYLFTRNKPKKIKYVAAVLCLFGCFLLAGVDVDIGIGFGVGEVLCALGGILYGVNTAATAAFAIGIYAPLYVFVQMLVHTFMCAFATVAFNYITVNGTPISPVYFEWNLTIIILITAVGLVGVTLCWILRTVVVRHVDASVVAVTMPFSAVIAGALSVLVGFDKPSITLLAGGAIVLISAIMSGLGDSNKLRIKKR
jgi:drug/metabolite transporter (DMT)-like permease